MPDYMLRIRFRTERPLPAETVGVPSEGIPGVENSYLGFAGLEAVEALVNDFILPEDGESAYHSHDVRDLEQFNHPSIDHDESFIHNYPDGAIKLEDGEVIA